MKVSDTEKFIDDTTERFRLGINAAYEMGQEDMKREVIKVIGGLVGNLIHDSFTACMVEATKAVDALPIKATP